MVGMVKQEVEEEVIVGKMVKEEQETEVNRVLRTYSIRHDALGKL